MKRSKLLSLAFMAALALTSITAATAAAETLPNILPLATGGEHVTATTNSSFSAFGSAGLTEVGSESSLGESVGENEKGGTFKILFFHIKNVLLGTCTGAATGEEIGSVAVAGNFEVRDADPKGVLTVVVLFKFNPQTEFACGGTKISLNGCVAGRLTPEGSATTLLKVTQTRVANDNEVVSYLSSTGLPEWCELLTKVGAGATELSAFSTQQNLTNFKKNGTALASVEVMPL